MLPKISVHPKQNSRKTLMFCPQPCLAHLLSEQLLQPVGRFLVICLTAEWVKSSMGSPGKTWFFSEAENEKLYLQ